MKLSEAKKRIKLFKDAGYGIIYPGRRNYVRQINEGLFHARDIITLDDIMRLRMQDIPNYIFFMELEMEHTIRGEKERSINAKIV